jgi:hypothetical protein
VIFGRRLARIKPAATVGKTYGSVSRNKAEAVATIKMLLIFALFLQSCLTES